MILKNLSIYSILLHFSSHRIAYAWTHNWIPTNDRYENHNIGDSAKGEQRYEEAAFKNDVENEHLLPVYKRKYDFTWNYYEGTRYSYGSNTGVQKPWYTSLNGFYTVTDRNDRLKENTFVDASEIYNSLETKYGQSLDLAQKLTEMESKFDSIDQLTKTLNEALQKSNIKIENLEKDLSDANESIKDLQKELSNQQKADQNNLDKIQKLEEISTRKIDLVAENFTQSDLEIRNSLELQAELFDEKVSNVESNFNSFKSSTLPSYETEVAEITKKVTELQVENDVNDEPSTTTQNSTQWYKVKSANTYTNMHWKLINQQLSWLEAFNYCQENFRPHGRLAEPNNRQLYEEMRIWLKNSYKVLEEENYYFVGGKSGSADSVYGCDMADNYQWVSLGKSGPQVPSVLGNTPLPYASTKRCCVAVHGMYDIRATECTKHRFVCEVADIV